MQTAPTGFAVGGPGPPALPEEPLPPGPPPPTEGGLRFGAGWGAALARGVLAFVLVLLVAQAVPWLGYATNPSEAPGTTDLLKVGGIVFYLFHHVGLVFDLPNLDLGALAEGPAATTPSAPVSATIAFALMLGAAIAVWVLYRGGRAVANRAGGSVAGRALHGAKPALVYALLSFGLSFVVGFTFELPPLPFFESGNLRIAPSPLGALLWPLVLGLIAGVWGGISSSRDELRRRPGASRALAAFSGGWRMAFYGLLFAFVGYLATAFLNPEVQLPFGPDHLRAVVSQPDVLSVVLAGFISLLFVPNVAVNVLVPAMGGSLGLYGGGISCNLLSYFSFPLGPGQAATDPAILVTEPCRAIPVELGTAPLAYFGFLLAPVLATIIGGRWTARRAEAASAAQGAGVGALAGLVFGVISALLMVLAGISVGGGGGALAGGFGGNQQITVGAGLILGTALAAAWGAAGGALGGALGAGRGGPEPAAVQAPVLPAEPPVAGPGPAPATAPQSVPPTPARPAPPAPEPRGKAARPQKDTGRVTGFEKQ